MEWFQQAHPKLSKGGLWRGTDLEKKEEGSLGWTGNAD